MSDRELLINELREKSFYIDSDYQAALIADFMLRDRKLYEERIDNLKRIYEVDIESIVNVLVKYKETQYKPPDYDGQRAVEAIEEALKIARVKVKE